MGIKRILQVIAGVFLLLVIILLGLYIIPPSQTEYEYKPQAYIEGEFRNEVGWYEGDDNRWYQVTWSAAGGLRLNHFDTLRSELLSYKLIKGQDLFFISREGSDNTVTFNEIDSNTHRMEVNDEDLKIIAFRDDSIFYKQEEIQYVDNSIRLVGTLFTPLSNSNNILMVFIHGSGVSDRDNFWYLYQADYLAKRGYTVLLPDKRGCGKSHSEWHIASFSDFADDVIAGINYVKDKSDIEKIGVIGLSQGGWISHVVAEKVEDVDFVVDVVSSATSPREQLHFEIKRDMDEGGAPGFVASILSTVFSKRAMGKRKIWWDKNRDYDPIAMMTKTNVPVLKIFGSEDKNVPVEKSLENMDQLMNDQPGLPITIKVFEGSGHALFNSKTNWIRSDYLELVDKWVKDLIK